MPAWTAPNLVPRAAKPFMPNSYSLTLSCADRPGIVAAVVAFLAGHHANILASQQYNARIEGRVLVNRSKTVVFHD
jgi:formyltetrahydrofolate hydrolase